MRVEILQASDKSDPFNQVVYFAASEFIGDRQFQVVRAFTADHLRSAKGEMMEEIMRLAEKQLALEFMKLLEQSIRQEFMKAIGASSFAASMPKSRLKENAPKEEAKLLPKDILEQLEQMDAKRIKEHLSVAV